MSVQVLLALMDKTVIEQLSADDLRQVTQVLVDHINADPSLKVRLTAAVQAKADEMVALGTTSGRI